jgi:hypothetical protein
MRSANSDRRKRRASRKSVSSRAPRVTDKTLNTNLGRAEEAKPSSGAPWYAGASTMPTTHADDVARAAREHFVKWIDWYLEAFPTETGGEAGGKGSQEQLGKRLGITPPAISAWRRKGSSTYPSTRSLIRFYLLIKKSWDGFRVDMLLFSDPPPLPKRR